MCHSCAEQCVASGVPTSAAAAAISRLCVQQAGALRASRATDRRMVETAVVRMEVRWDHQGRRIAVRAELSSRSSAGDRGPAAAARCSAGGRQGNNTCCIAARHRHRSQPAVPCSRAAAGGSIGVVGRRARGSCGAGGASRRLQHSILKRKPARQRGSWQPAQLELSSSTPERMSSRADASKQL